MVRYVFQILSFFSPIIFYLIVVAGIVIDILVGFTGAISFTGIIIALAYYLVVFFCLLFTIKVESKANKQSISMIENSDILSAEDVADLKKLLNTYVIIYILDFTISILKMIYQVLKIASKFSKSN